MKFDLDRLPGLLGLAPMDTKIYTSTDRTFDLAAPRREDVNILREEIRSLIGRREQPDHQLRHVPWG